MWIMPRGSSSVSRNSGMRELPASSKVLSNSDSGSFSSSAMISARGTMMSSTRLAPNRKSRSSMLFSASEKLAAGPGAFNASSSVSRSVCWPVSPSFKRRTCSQP